MAMFQFEYPGDGENAVETSNEGFQEAWNAFDQGRYLLSAGAFNSLLVGVAQVMDILSDAQKTQQRAPAALEGRSDHTVDTYFGLLTASNNTTVPIVGAFAVPPPPVDATDHRRACWQATAECVIRLGDQPIEEATGDMPPLTGAKRVVELFGACGDACYPQAFVTSKTGVRINAELARNFAFVYRGVTAYTVRVLAAVMGNAPVAAAVTPVETGAMPTINAYAEIYTKERRMRTGLALGAMGVGGLVASAGAFATRGNKRRR